MQCSVPAFGLAPCQRNINGLIGRALHPISKGHAQLISVWSPGKLTHIYFKRLFVQRAVDETDAPPQPRVFSTVRSYCWP